MEISKKVILLGRFGVGKTSLIRRFVHQVYSDEYLTTIGVKIDKKVLSINGGKLSMIIWDIAGESSHTKIPPTYKLGSHGIIYVFDVTRSASYKLLKEELSGLREVLPNVPIQVVGNKIDLLDEISKENIRSKLNLLAEGLVFTSAKTGENVELIFEELAVAMLK